MAEMPLSSLTFRLAQLSDAEEIARLHFIAWNDPRGPSPSIEQRRELWYHLLGGGPRRVRLTVAVDRAGCVRGFCGTRTPRSTHVANPDDDDDDDDEDAKDSASTVEPQAIPCELVFLYVDPNAQKLGIGSRLLRTVVTGLQAQGIRRLIARADPAIPAYSFFIRHGWAPYAMKTGLRASGHWISTKL